MEETCRSVETRLVPAYMPHEKNQCIDLKYLNDEDLISADLESLLEMDLDIYIEPEDHLVYDPCVSLETLALQSPHGSSCPSKSNSWQEDSNEENNELIEETVEKIHFDSKNDRRRLSLRKELFHHRIKAHDISSPGPKSSEEMKSISSCTSSTEQPEYDLASPLALPPSPTSFYESEYDMNDHGMNNQDENRDELAAKVNTSGKQIRTRKVKHGGIYSLLLKGIKRADEDSAFLIKTSLNDPSITNWNAMVDEEHVNEQCIISPEQPHLKRTSPSPSKMQIRHGGIYRMLREKT